MISKGLKISLLVVLLSAGALVAVMLRLDNARLRRNLAVSERNKQQATQLREDNERARALLAQTETTGSDAARAVQRDVERWRGEVAALEKAAIQNAQAQQAGARGDASSLEQNRDPEAGLTRLENFHDAGQATPGAAFQTFVWAALKGDETKQADMISFADTSRATAEAILAALPEPDRLKFPTPEKLAALFFADAFTQMQAAHVTGVTLTDAQHAMVVVRGLTPREQKIPMQLGPNGWQIAISESMARVLDGWTQRKLRPPAK
jgi:hypothetical protein